MFKGQDLTKLASDLVAFMSKNGVKFSKKEMPAISFTKQHKNEESPIFNSTGRFYPELGLVVVFITGRDVKDCLRSLAHELIHADQHLNQGIDTQVASDGILDKGKKAEKIESEAYLRGNLLFRKWEESVEKSISKK